MSAHAHLCNKDYGNLGDNRPRLLEGIGLALKGPKREMLLT